MAFQRREPFLGDIEPGAPGARFGRPPQHPVDIGGILAGQRPQLTLPGQLGFQRAGIDRQLFQVVAELMAHIDNHRQRLADLRGQRVQLGVIGRFQCGPCPPQAVGGTAAGQIVELTRQRCAGRGRGFAQRVQFGEPHDLGDQGSVLTGLRVDGVDLVERELQPVGLEGEFPHAAPAF